MKKRMIAALIVCALTASMLAACSSGEESASSSTSSASSQVSSKPEASEAESSEKPEASKAESSEEPESSEDGGTVSSQAAASSQASTSKPAASSPAVSAPAASAPAASSPAAESKPVAQSSAPSSNAGRLNDVTDAVKKAYGENYLPSMDLTADDLSSRFGLNSDDYAAAYGQVAMISTQVDTFVAVEAKDGKADAVASALNSYRDDLVNNSMQYPMNIPKVNASRVYQKGNYVFFLMLGAAAPNDVMDDEAASLTFYQQQNDIAVKAIDGVLGA